MVIQKAEAVVSREVRRREDVRAQANLGLDMIVLGFALLFSGLAVWGDVLFPCLSPRNAAQDTGGAARGLQRW